MGERSQEQATSEPPADMLTPGIDELLDDEFDEILPISLQSQHQVEKRRRVEQRLEEKRLRDELGYYDMDLDDF